MKLLILFKSFCDFSSFQSCLFVYLPAPPHPPITSPPLLPWFHLFLSPSTSKTVFTSPPPHPCSYSPTSWNALSSFFLSESDPSSELSPSSSSLPASCPALTQENPPVSGSAILLTPHLQNERATVDQRCQTHGPQAKSGLYIYRLAPTFKNQSRFTVSHENLEALAFHVVTLG